MADEILIRPSIRYILDVGVERTGVFLRTLGKKIRRTRKEGELESTDKTKVPKKILDVGCGMKKTPGALGIDQVKLEGVDIVHDLNVFPWADLEDETFDEIIMDDVLEHLDDVIAVIRECYRLLKLDGKLFIRVVYWNHVFAFSDPTHKHFFSEIVFKFFTGEWRPYYMDFRFRDLNIEYIFDRNAMRKFGKSKKRLLKKAYFYCNVIRGLNITLTK